MANPFICDHSSCHAGASQSVYRGRPELIDHILVSRALIDDLDDTDVWVGTSTEALLSITDNPTERRTHPALITLPSLHACSPFHPGSTSTRPRVTFRDSCANEPTFSPGRDSAIRSCHVSASAGELLCPIVEWLSRADWELPRVVDPAIQ
jgi:hypothetical protein